MTKKELQQIFYLNREVAMWQDELEAARDSSTYTLAGGIRGNEVSDKTGNKAAKIADLERVITENIAEIQIQREKIINYILTVDDSIMRQILMYRHVQLMSWDMVANTISGGNTAEGVRKRHNRFLNEKAPD